MPPDKLSDPGFIESVANHCQCMIRVTRDPDPTKTPTVKVRIPGAELPVLTLECDSLPSALSVARMLHGALCAAVQAWVHDSEGLP